MSKHRVVKTVLALTVAFCGGMVIGNWKLAIGVGLMIWADNISQINEG